MKIKCVCGETVVEGSIDYVPKKNGGQRKVFNAKLNEIIGRHTSNLFNVVREIPMNGEIHKNGSSDPNKWTGLCSKCQTKNPDSEVKKQGGGD